jgi:hypothetical protein
MLMSLNYENTKENLFTTKKTKPTQASDEISNVEIEKQELEQDNQSFHKRITEKIISTNQRIDKYGNPIKKGGRQRVTFIDKINSGNFTDVIPIESFKEFNKVDEFPTTDKNAFNSCCSVF